MQISAFLAREQLHRMLFGGGQNALETHDKQWCGLFSDCFWYCSAAEARTHGPLVATP
jgi:hypothetical protein